MGVNTWIKRVILTLICCGTLHVCNSAQLSIKYERPESSRFKEIYKVLKSNHATMYGESERYLEGLYDWPYNIEVIVTTCGKVDSRYLPDSKMIVICYESLDQKIYDYPENASSKEAFAKRVHQNVMFTFWHEVGHALMHQFEISKGIPIEQKELLADEFAALSMLWRAEDAWKDILMISALHFMSKSTKKPTASYANHPSDDLRYQRMIVLLYGFAQKSYSRLASEVDGLVWLDISAQEYYLERSAFWEENLREHTRPYFFNN